MRHHHAGLLAGLDEPRAGRHLHHATVDGQLGHSLLLPWNPVILTDTKAMKYIQEHGDRNGTILRQKPLTIT